MSKTFFVLLALLGVCAIVALSTCGMALSYRTDCVRHEAGIKAQQESNRSEYDSMWKKFTEMAQVPQMYIQDLKSVYDGVMQGRYGAEGSQAMIQFIQEHNPNVDPVLYQKLMTAIEAGRNAFNAAQQTMVSKKQAYEITLNSNRGVMVGWLFGFPKLNIDDYKIITSDRTEDVFAHGRADAIKLRED